MSIRSHDAKNFACEENSIRFGENTSELTILKMFEIFQEGKLTDIVGVPTSKVWFIPLAVEQISGDKFKVCR